MSDILFRCPGCSKRLAIDGAAKGRIAKCPDCGKPVQVPRADVAFECPSCAWSLAAPSVLEGEKFHCPNCEGELGIPAPARKPPPPERPMPGRLRIKPSLATAPVRQCHACGSAIPEDAVFCVKCGLDLRTGRPLQPAARTRQAPATVFPQGSADEGLRGTGRGSAGQEQTRREPIEKAPEVPANPSLVKCRDCGSDVSRSAEKCPKCGASTMTPGNCAAGCLVFLLGSLILWAFLMYWWYSPTSTPNAERRSVSREKSMTASQSYETGKACAGTVKERYVGVPDYDQCLGIARRMALDYPDIDMAEFERGFRDGW